MESVGPKLRAIRLQQGLTLEDISAKTCISTRILQAIEKDDPSVIGSRFFYRSFVRQFAQQLRLDDRELESAIQSLSNTLDEPLMPGQTGCGATLPSLPALRSSRRKGLRWIYSFTSLIVMLVACSSLYSAWQNSRSRLEANVSSWMHSILERRVEQRSAAAAAPAAHNVQPPVGVPASVTASEPVFRVELSAIERTWLSIVADGEETFTGTLETAQTKVLEGHDTARVRTANAGGLTVVYNGKAIGSLGPRGQVRTVVFTRTGYEMFEPAPTPAAHLLFTHFVPNGE
jgi:cytoskeletal protein RodZ